MRFRNRLSYSGQWAKGHSQFPLKLQKLLPINALLAHTPWLLRPEHIGELLHGEDSWTLGELVHAVVIICTAHAECSAVYGMGLNADLNDLSGVHDAEVVGLVGIAEGVDPGEDHTAELASELQRAELTGSDDAAVFDKERQAREFEQAGKDGAFLYVAAARRVLTSDQISPRMGRVIRTGLIDMWGRTSSSQPTSCCTARNTVCCECKISRGDNTVTLW